MALPQVRIPVDLDRPRTLVLDFNALCKVEEVTGINLLVGEAAFSSMRMVRAMVWAGLLHEDPTLSLHRVGEILQTSNMEKILDAIVKAYDAAMPEPEPDAEAPSDSDPTNPQPGGASGQRPATT